MEIYITKIIGLLMLPPGINLVLVLIALLLLRRARWLAHTLISISLLSLLILSLPAVGNSLLNGLHIFDPVEVDDAAFAELQAIVVLGGGRNDNAPEYGGETVSASTLARVRFAARLHRATRLPILVTGGHVFSAEGASEAALMKQVLEQEFTVPVQWIEEQSRNTAENAKFTAQILTGANIVEIALVTHASHMPRAAERFDLEGLKVFAVPTGFASSDARSGVMDWIPSANGLGRSASALYEYIGQLWYRIRY